MPTTYGGFSFDTENMRKSKSHDNRHTFSMTVETSDTTTAEVVLARLETAILNLGDQAIVNFKVTSHKTTTLTNSPF